MYQKKYWFVVNLKTHNSEMRERSWNNDKGNDLSESAVKDDTPASDRCSTENQSRPFSYLVFTKNLASESTSYKNNGGGRSKRC